MARDTIDPSECSKTRTFSCYEPEWEALGRMKDVLKLHTPFDVMRFIARNPNHPVVVDSRNRRDFHDPRPASIRPKRNRRVA